MIIKDNKIIETTERELFSYWNTRKLNKEITFPEYLNILKEAGVVIRVEELK